MSLADNETAEIYLPTAEQLDPTFPAESPLLVTPKLKEHEVISYDPLDYQIEHIKTDELAEIISSSHGDARLFETHLGLYRFLNNYRFKSLGSEQDPVKLYDCYLADIEKRIGQLGLSHFVAVDERQGLAA